MNSPTLAHSTDEEINDSSVATQSPTLETNTRGMSHFMESGLQLDTYEWQNNNLMTFIPPPPINQHMYRLKQPSTDSIISVPADYQHDAINKDLSCEYPLAMSSQLSFTENTFKATNFGYNTTTQHAYPSPYSQHNTFNSGYNSTPNLSYDSKVDMMNNYGKFDLGNQSFESSNSPKNSYMRFSDHESPEFVRSCSQTSYQLDFALHSFTPTLSDAYTPTFSDTPYFTPNTSINEEFSSFHIAPPVLDQVVKNTLKPKLSNSNLKICNSYHNEATKTVRKPGIVTYSNQNTSLLHSSPQKGDVSQPSKSINSKKRTTIKSSTSQPSMNQLVFALNKSQDSLPLRTASVIKTETDHSKNYLNGYTHIDRTFSLKQMEFSNSETHKLQPQNNCNSKPKRHTRRRLTPRSKNGCWICRIKHLKCDELKPTCSGCLKCGVECDYSEIKPLYVLDKTLRKEKLLSLSVIRRRKQNIKGQNKFSLPN